MTDELMSLVIDAKEDLNKIHEQIANVMVKYN